MPTDAWKQRCWRDIGTTCLVYGGIVTFVGAFVLAVLLGNQGSLLHLAAISDGWRMVDLLIAGVGVFSLFLIRSRTATRRLTPIYEGIIAALSAVFALPIAVIGAILLATTSEYTYTGIEKWLPDIQDKASHELSRVQQVVTELELSSDVYNRVLELLETARDKGLMRNRPFEEMLGAMVYIASREGRDPRTFGEIADATDASKRRIGQSYRYIGRNTDVNVVPPPPEDYLPRFADKLQLGDMVQDRAEDIIQQAVEEHLLSGKSPTGTAAASLFIAAGIEGDERTLTEMADLLDVTSITIRERTREFLENLELEGVPEHFYHLGED